ncbi:hypothetical protein [Ciceribacter sp. T2.26MG-112.2]|uniref:hypothetical protein n=1 Tax=Ciceribacter sp. T2.26MG-112.2 TaxID=3137154 RepID=UPI0012B6861C|nr:hypothetical protein [Ciceribacter naphthalenivorans]
MTSPDVWSWSEYIAFIGGTGLVSGLGSALLIALFDFLKAQSIKSEEAKFIALHTAVALERFAIECWHRKQVSDAYHHRGNVASGWRDFPNEPSLPNERDWRSFDGDLSAKVATFLNEIRISEYRAEFAKNLEDNPFHWDDEVRIRGTEAWQLAEEIRVRYQLRRVGEQRKAISDLFKA